MRMKTSYWTIVLGVVISGSVIFGLSFEFSLEKERYEIEITGLKDVYLVGEPYSFSYNISGYGYACADRTIAYPDENGNTMITRVDVDCNSEATKTKFVIDSKNESQFENIKIKKPGRYNVGVMFEKSTNFEPTQSGKEFHVVEKICNDSSPQEKATCFSDAFDSCTSAFVEFALPTGEGDGILITGIVESWYECNLRVYADHSQDRYRGDTTQTRSICDGISLSDESILFENCNNENTPPIRFHKQYYLQKEKCEIYGGYWDFESSTCLDFSDEYDCAEMGGSLVPREFAQNQAENKNSDMFSCEFEQLD